MEIRAQPSVPAEVADVQEGPQMAGEPGELYELHLEVPQIDDLVNPVLVHALDGYVDAGSGVSLAVTQLLDKLESTVVATFDVDQLIDYRARRPTLPFAR